MIFISYNNIMKKLKSLLVVILLLVMLFTLTACGEKEENTSSTQGTLDYINRDKNSSGTENDSSKFLSDLKSLSSEEILANAEKQMSEPEEGETIAIMHVKDYGDIKIKFFDDVAPMAVENFVTHAKEGYYDGVTFHRIVEDFMIQGGDPEGTGSGGESIWGEDFAEELDATILPYRGSISMASRGTGTVSLGSQFFINQARSSESVTSYLSQSGYDNLVDACNKYGGALSSLVLYAQYTTFGQVFDGMDIVDEISKSEVKASSSGELSSPVTPIVIESIEITTYSK